MEALLVPLGVLRPHWPEAMEEILRMRWTCRLRMREHFMLPYFPLIRIRDMNGDVVWDRTIPEHLRDEYVRSVL